MRLGKVLKATRNSSLLHTRSDSSSVVPFLTIEDITSRHVFFLIASFTLQLTSCLVTNKLRFNFKKIICHLNMPFKFLLVDQEHAKRFPSQPSRRHLKITIDFAVLEGPTYSNIDFGSIPSIGNCFLIDQEYSVVIFNGFIIFR